MQRMIMLVSVLAMLALCSDALAQSSEYVPSYRLPQGTEIGAIYIGAKSCGPCHLPETKQAIERMKQTLAEAARGADWSFAVIGVSTDWKIDDGLEFLGDSGNYDEIIVGRNWVNLGLSQFVWATEDIAPILPQVIIARRKVNPRGSSRISMENYQILGQLTIPMLQRWLDDGAQIEALSR